MAKKKIWIKLWNSCIFLSFTIQMSTWIHVTAKLLLLREILISVPSRVAHTNILLLLLLYIWCIMYTSLVSHHKLSRTHFIYYGIFSLHMHSTALQCTAIICTKLASIVKASTLSLLSYNNACRLNISVARNLNYKRTEKKKTFKRHFHHFFSH